MSISTPEELKDYIHSIHDFIRNSGAGYSMTALKIFMIFYGLKIIEPVIDKTPFDPKICTFSKIKERATKKYGKKSDNEKDNPLTWYIDNDILDEIHKQQKEKNNWHFYMFFQIPKGLDDDVWNKIMDYIDELPTKNEKDKKSKKINSGYDVDLSGKVYEYFIGRDEQAISELGAYFTVREITKYTIEKVKPTLDDGNVRKMIDPFGGSGGFTMGYVQYINDHFKDIKWKNNIDNIHHYDMNEDVLKIAGIELFGLTHCLPKYDINCKRVNTFKYEFGTIFGDVREEDKFDYIFTNPPYGGDKTKKSAYFMKQEKILKELTTRIKTITEEINKDKKNKELQKKKVKYEEQMKKVKSDIDKHIKTDEKSKVNTDTCSKAIKNFIKEHKLKTCNDKESCSLVLFMAILAENGTCAGVLKEGIFFDGKYKSVRECVIKNFNVKYVVSVPQDQFENTSTKTSILIFENTKQKTKEIMFYDLIVDKEPDDVFDDVDGELRLVKSKGAIKGVHEKLICSVKVDDLTDDYSLNYKKYLKRKIKVLEGFELKKIGDVITYDKKSKRKASDGNESGKYNFYTSSYKIKKTDICDYDEERLILGTGGKSSLFVDKKFSCSADNFVCKIDNKNVLNYLFNYIKMNWTSFVLDLSSGSTLSHINKENLNNYQIPFPKDMTKFKLILDNLMKLHERQQKLIDLIPEKERNICDKIQGLIDNGKKGTEYDEYKLGDVCDYIKTGKNKTPDDKKGTKYPYYGTLEITGYTDHFLFEGEHILMARNGSKLHENCFIVDGKFYPSDHVFTIKNNNNIVKLQYLYYYMLSQTEKIKDISNGSTVKGISKAELENVTIKILLGHTIKNNLQPLFDEVEKLKVELENNKKEHYELSIKFMKMIDPEYGNTQQSIEDKKQPYSPPELDNENESSDAEDEKPKKKKSSSNKKIENNSDSSSDSGDEKPQKIKKTKKKVNDGSDSEDDKPKKLKKTKKVSKSIVVVKVESDDSDEEHKPKKIHRTK